MEQILMNLLTNIAILQKITFLSFSLQITYLYIQLLGWIMYDSFITVNLQGKPQKISSTSGPFTERGKIRTTKELL